MRHRLSPALSLLLLLLLFTACGADRPTEPPVEKASVTLPPIESFAEPPALPPVIDEGQIASRERAELEFDMYSITDRLENGDPCRECIYSSDGSLFSQTYYTYGDKGLAETDTYQPDGTLSSYCLFLYDVDAQGNRVKGDSIYLSDASAFPAKWQDASAVHLTRVTGDYYPSKDYSCDDFSNPECQRAFYVKDVE